MYCTSCGKQLVSNAAFCSFCGTRVIQPSQEKAPPTFPETQPNQTWTQPALLKPTHTSAETQPNQAWTQPEPMNPGPNSAETQPNQAWTQPEPVKPMPNLSPRLYTFWGIGTSFKGATDRTGDGSFLTTRWFTVFGFPFIPVDSYRVVFGGSGTSFSGMVHTTTKQYYIQSKEKLSPVHVVRTYGLYASVFLLFGIEYLSISLFPSGASDKWFIISFIEFCVWLVAFTVFAVRFWRAK